MGGRSMGVLVDVGMGVLHRAVAVRVHVEIAAVPTNEQANRQGHDDKTDSRLGRALDRIREVPAKEYDRESEGEQRGGMAQPPGQTEFGSSARPIPRVSQEERR